MKGIGGFLEWLDRGGKQIPVSAGWEWQALILAASLTLMIGGPGCLSIDTWFRSRFRVKS